MSARRVLMTADAVGGVFAYALDLAQALASDAIEVVLAVMGPAPSDAQRAQARAVPELSLIEAPYRLEWMDEPWSDVDEAGRWLLRLARETRPQWVHLNGYAHAALPFDAPKLVVAHSCVSSWWEAVKQAPAPDAYDVYRERARAGLRAADVVVAPSRTMLDAVVRHHGAPRASQVIYNGTALAPNPSHVRSRERVAAVGRVWDEAKNLRELASMRLPWPIAIAGDRRGPNRSSVRGTNCIGPLSRDGVRALLESASIFAAPAYYEPFGLAILEAATAGCALVLGDIPSLRELWGDDALFVPPGDARALEDALRTLCASHTQREALGARAHGRAQQFSLARMGAGYRALYSDLATRRQPTPREDAPCVSSASITR